MTLELAHAGLLRVSAHERAQRPRRDLELARAQPGVVAGAAQEVRPRDLVLHALAVAGELDRLETVEQRLGDRTGVGRGREEEAVREVERDAEVLVEELAVLLRVEQ